MWRRIRLPLETIRRASRVAHMGRSVSIAVALDWPELQLTEAEMMANAAAAACGQQPPYPPRNFVIVEVEGLHDMEKHRLAPV